ncbi:MAG TPA: translation elongation factor Ts [Dehalococcoidia bacterium]|nr:translation elongation factor Ts [Dehalococcoidia bacterium]
MAAISNKDVMKLREVTSAGVMDCKRALEAADGDMNKAAEILREQGIARAAKKASREARQGIVDSYVHGGGRIGVLVEINCETDFVARNESFRQLAHDIAMQIAATNPLYVSEEEMSQTPPADGQFGTPDALMPRAEEVVLLAQPFIKDPGLTIRDLITNAVASLGENIQVRRFQRFELGQ